MIVKLLTEHHLEFLSLKGGCLGSSESTHVKMPHCWMSHALAHMINVYAYSAGALYHTPLYNTSTDISTCIDTVMLWSLIFNHGILQWNYRKMTINGHFPIIPL